MKDGPLKSAFEKYLTEKSSTEGVLYQELTTYKINLDGMLTKETVTRRFGHDGNYHDTTHQLPLVKTNE
tara:strand:+ start:5026 stop:5232 length:207 start_codon:yes stop_codon:yes gene_type:complete